MPDDPYNLSLSVFFPCYNEAGNIERVVGRAREALPRLVTDWEIIVVNDGSTDATGEIADRLAADDRRVRVVHLASNGGYGLALRGGFDAATKDYVFFTDGDGQFDIAELRMLLELVGRFDIIMGYRRRRSDHLVRRFNTWCWTRLVCAVLGFKCRDVDCAFKLMRRALPLGMSLKSTGALINAELLGKAAARGLTFAELPVTHYRRCAGSPTGAKIGVILRAFAELVRLRRDITRPGG
jgi:glycosyltransferase involved in cell wall biosynthesis